MAGGIEIKTYVAEIYVLSLVFGKKGFRKKDSSLHFIPFRMTANKILYSYREGVEWPRLRRGHSTPSR